MELHIVEIGSLGDFLGITGSSEGSRIDISSATDSFISIEMCSSFSTFSASILSDLKVKNEHR